MIKNMLFAIKSVNTETKKDEKDVVLWKMSSKQILIVIFTDQ